MKIAFIIRPTTINIKDGIRMQALIWKEALENIGHTVKSITPWENYDWASFDIIHFFGNGLWLCDYIETLSQYNSKIVVSPIIDTFRPLFIYKVASHISIPFLRLYSSNYALRKIKGRVKSVLVRSEHEYKYIRYAYGYPQANISIIRLPCRYVEDTISLSKKENFCFHVSPLYQSRKNVIRLIKAAIKYKFRLVLAGSLGSEAQFKPLKQLIKEHNNIEVIGVISEKSLIDFYQRAKVFALPSIVEGVGFVALEAAYWGCQIVITKIGGPKEYYKGKAHEVNPYSIDEIGKAILKALNAETNIELSDLIRSTYTISNTAKELERLYRSVSEE